MSSTQLMMRRENLLELPEPEVPAGYLVRRATAADAPAMAALMTAAFEPDSGAPMDPEAVFERLLLAPIVRATYLVTDEAGLVRASASAAYLPDRFDDVGYVHWVAADPACAGSGLGRAASAAVLHEFATWGVVAAVLETDDHRLPAVASYLKLGFRPFWYRRDHPARWAAVLDAMARR